MTRHKKKQRHVFCEQPRIISFYMPFHINAVVAVILTTPFLSFLLSFLSAVRRPGSDFFGFFSVAKIRNQIVLSARRSNLNVLKQYGNISSFWLIDKYNV